MSFSTNSYFSDFSSFEFLQINKMSKLIVSHKKIYFPSEEKFTTDFDANYNLIKKYDQKCNKLNAKISAQLENLKSLFASPLSVGRQILISNFPWILVHLDHNKVQYCVKEIEKSRAQFLDLVRKENSELSEAFLATRNLQLDCVEDFKDVILKLRTFVSYPSLVMSHVHALIDLNRICSCQISHGHLFLKIVW